MALPIILLADNDPVYLQNAKEFLERKGYHILSASDPIQAKKYLTESTLALAIIDFRLVNDDDDRDRSGFNLAWSTINTTPVPKIILTKFDRVEYAVASLKPGKTGTPAAIDFVVKQEGLERLFEAVEQALIRAKIFLCYARPDRERVSEIYDTLMAKGLRPWMDHKCILAGEKWETAIRKAIKTTDFFVVCLSSNSVNRRGFMQKEIRLALSILDEQLDEDIYLIPARLDDIEIAHPQLNELQWVDLYAQDGMERLAQAINNGLVRRSLDK